MYRRPGGSGHSPPPVESATAIDAAALWEPRARVIRACRGRWVKQIAQTPGKRNALRIGVEHTSGEIAVLCDSDTIWTDDTLSELVKPFRHRDIGGVTTRQRIIDPGRSVLTRWADWHEGMRSEYSVPAMSVLGTVGCLPGRTIAFRRQILLDYMDRSLAEKFLGSSSRSATTGR